MVSNEVWLLPPAVIPAVQFYIRRYFTKSAMEAVATLATVLLWLFLILQIQIHAQDLLLAGNAATFSKAWMGEYAAGLGCNATDPYTWRAVGYGSNINILSLVWANAICAGRNDLSVVVNNQRLFSKTNCSVASNGVVDMGGWSCFFAPMPHVCAFDTKQDLFLYNARRGVSQAQQQVIARRGGIMFVREREESIRKCAADSGFDIVEVLANLYEYLLFHLQPWCKADIQAVLEEPDIAAVRQGKYVSMHIRRTDKMTTENVTETKAYFEHIVNYLNSPGPSLTATDITGLWLSTDDETVVKEVKEMVPSYLPNITPERVVSITGRVPVSPRFEDRNTYQARVLLLTEMKMLAGSEVFSGTMTTNIGRIVVLMRYTLGKPKESVVSADDLIWAPGRFR